MWNKIRITLLILIAIVTFFLSYLLVTMPKSERNNPSNIDICVMAINYGMFFLTLFIYGKVEGVYQRVMLACFTCLISVISMTICSTMVSHLPTKGGHK